MKVLRVVIVITNSDPPVRILAVQLWPGPEFLTRMYLTIPVPLSPVSCLNSSRVVTRISQFLVECRNGVKYSRCDPRKGFYNLKVASLAVASAAATLMTY